MKFKEPIKGKGMRTLFRKNAFITYLVDEIRTRCKCRCSSCEGLNEKCKVMENHKPYRSGSVLVYGLLKCKSCGGVWNRECNGATNIYKLVKNEINKIDRLSYLYRRNKSDSLEEV